MPRRLASQSFVAGKLPATAARPQLAAAWESLVRDDVLRLALDHPGRLLSDYFRQRKRSSLGDSVSLANRLGETCDTVFVVAQREEIASCEALIAAAAHPAHNLLADNQRGGRPRVVFIEPGLDTDSLQGAIDLVRRVGEGHDLHERWAVVVIAPADGEDQADRNDLRQGAAPLIEVLRVSVGGTNELSGRLVVLDVGPEQASELVPAGVAFHTLTLEQRTSLLDGPALFLSALVGADSISQLKGAVWFWEAAKCKLSHESNVVALAEYLSQPSCRIAAWHQAVERLCRSLADGNEVQVSPTYLHAARRQLNDEPETPTLHVWSDAIRRDPLSRDHLTRQSTDDAEPAFVADALRAAYARWTPAAEIRISRLNDIAIGELCQWFSAAKLLLKLANKNAP
ncbi:MAG: hypothetical protein K8U03_03730 [Planctomycetia bacterium]|nr:hypothetical protein [Planctomycetia bacterium]